MRKTTEYCNQGECRLEEIRLIINSQTVSSISFFSSIVSKIRVFLNSFRKSDEEFVDGPNWMYQSSKSLMSA
jgi:hypothetical protein